MNLTTVLSRVVETGLIDDGQVCVVADALEEKIGKDFAERFVNKRLSDSDIARALSERPGAVMPDGLQKLCAIWNRQEWISHHSLAERAAKPPTPSEADRLKERIAELKNAYANDTETLKRRIAELEDANSKTAAEMARLKEGFPKETAKLKSENADEQERLRERIAELENELKKTAIECAALRGKDYRIENEPMPSFIPEDLHLEVLPIWKELGGNLDATRIVSLFIGAVSSARNNNIAFANRFKAFDVELYTLFRDDEAKLTDIRRQFKKLLDGRTAGCEVTWDLVGDPINSDLHIVYGLGVHPLDNTMTVTKVKTALIRTTEGKCLGKARVEFA